MQSESQFMTRAEFARDRGWNRSYVTKLGQQGRLVLDSSEKLINVVATLARLSRTDDPAKESVRQHHAAARVEKDVGAFVKHDAPTLVEPSDKAADPKYWGNKTRREGALAELAELELAKKRDELVERPRVEAMAFAAGRTLRDAVLGLPTQLAPTFTTMTDAFEIEVKMRDALRQVFADAAKMTADDLNRASEHQH
jgi:hypothetical protein